MPSLPGAPTRASTRRYENFETLFKATHIHTVRVEPGSPAEGKTIAELDLKDRFGIREFGFRRGAMRFTQPDPVISYPLSRKSPKRKW